MDNNDYTLWFALMSLFNTNLGLSNLNKNTEQEERQKRIEAKLDELLRRLE